MEKGLVKLNPSLMSIISRNGGTDILPFRQEIFVINVFIAGTGYCERISEAQKMLCSSPCAAIRRTRSTSSQ